MELAELLTSWGALSNRKWPNCRGRIAGALLRPREPVRWRNWSVELALARRALTNGSLNRLQHDDLSMTYGAGSPLTRRAEGS